jgi:hypothetical protein
MCPLARIVIVSAIMVGAPAVSSAQAIGAKAGLARMDVRFDDGVPFDARPKAGVVAGGFVTVDWRWRISIQAEALFVQRSVEIEEVITDRLRYIEVPILGRYPVMRRAGLTVHAVGGVNIAFLLDAVETSPGARSDVSQAIRSRDVALVAGAAAQVGPRLVIDFRYLHGVSKLYRAPEFPATQRGIEITAGWLLWR